VLLNRVLDPIPESEAEKAGSDAMLLKPLDGPMLVGTVNSLIEKMRSQMVASAADPEISHSNGFGRKHNESRGDGNGAGDLAKVLIPETSNGTSGLAALVLAISDTAGAADARADADGDTRAGDPPAAAMPPDEQGFEPEGMAVAAKPGRPVVRTVPGEQIQTMSETDACVDQDQQHEFSPAVDFAAIVDEALGNDAEERDMQRRIEQAIHQILRPAISAVAENVTREVYGAYRAQRRVEEAVNGLLLPAIVSIADGSSQGVLAAFRSK
jgi:hypothetical protein